MPAAIRYYSPADVSEMLQVGRTKANEILNMFGQKGQLLRQGKVKRVRAEIFEAWLAEQDGFNQFKASRKGA